MDQLKEALRLAVKYRFWIVVGIACLMPVIAYFTAKGSIQETFAKGKAEIESADKDIKQYVSGTFPNNDYKDLTEARTADLSKDVNVAWRELYNQQAPLLTWPDEVKENFAAWGTTKWPENVDAALVRQTITTYMQVYPEDVKQVYESFRPFNYEEGTGVVAAPPEDVLLRPAKFSISKPPAYGKIIAAKQKLWIQGTVLDVINKVNGPNAKDWDGAAIKEITALEVANPKAQDQRSIGKGETLDLAPELVEPGTETAGDTAGSSPAMEGADPSMMANMMGRGMGMMGSGMGGNATAPEEVYLLHTENTEAPFRVAPVYIAVLIEQNRMLEVFEQFKKSPMTIQIVDCEMNRPKTSVKKPKKGDINNFSAFGMGMPGGEMFLGASGMMDPGMMGMMMPGMSGMGGGPMMDPGMMGMMPGYGMPAAVQKKGISVVQKQIDKDKQARDKAKGKDSEKKADKPESADLYLSVVELHIYGQARFYNPPPPPEAEPAPTESAGNAAAEDTPKAAEDTPKTAEDTAKTAEDTAKAEGTPKAEDTPKTEAKPEESPKAAAEAPKAEETPKASAPETAPTPKSETP